jgi:hypothetical protein
MSKDLLINKFADKFDKDIYKDINTCSISKVLALNSSLSIISKMLLNIYNIITLSFIASYLGIIYSLILLPALSRMCFLEESALDFHDS